MNILLAHGSSDSSHNTQVGTLADTVSALLGEEVGFAFLSDHKLPEGARVLPLFLGEGQHVSKDIPKLAAKSDCVLLPALAHHADAIADMAVDMLTRETRRINAMCVLYRFAGFEKLSAALYARVKVCSKHALASLHSEPSVNAVLQHWQQQGIDNISLQPMLLFEGHSLARLQGMIKDTKMQISSGPVLCEHEDFPALVAKCLSNNRPEVKA
ncbi:MAG: sirohydrochlorin chelatase [Mariprofundus sp.]